MFQTLSVVVKVLAVVHDHLKVEEALTVLGGQVLFGSRKAKESDQSESKRKEE